MSEALKFITKNTFRFKKKCYPRASLSNNLFKMSLLISTANIPISPKPGIWLVRNDKKITKLLKITTFFKSHADAY